MPRLLLSLLLSLRLRPNQKSLSSSRSTNPLWPATTPLSHQHPRILVQQRLNNSQYRTTSRSSQMVEQLLEPVQSMLPMNLLLHQRTPNSQRLSSLISHNLSHRTNNLLLPFIPMTATTATTQTTTAIREELNHRRITRPSWADTSSRKVQTRPTDHPGT